jgi:DNA-binding SARP family transcriptional activator
MTVVNSAAATHPERWRGALRRQISRSETNIGAATLLEEIGHRSDVGLLRAVARQHARRRKSAADLGRRLARRTAERIFIEDLGRVHVRVGAQLVPGSSIRRKVLGLLCFLLTRPGMSGTRDQVLDALWPDLEPTVAVNSLNQTLYFLRRIFEEDYKEDLSPGYVHHDSEVIWLDPELVDSRSRTTWALIRSIDSPANPDQVDRLAELYSGRFALDFEYEDWSIAFRDTLHASYLEVIERAVMDDFAVGHYSRAIRVARRLLTVEPSADNVEATLLRLYRLTGAHAAAAEQYAHYSTLLRDLGIEPPPLESL